MMSNIFLDCIFIFFVYLDNNDFILERGKMAIHTEFDGNINFLGENR